MLKFKGIKLTDNAIKRLTYIANKAGTRYVRLDIKVVDVQDFEYKWETTIQGKILIVY